MTGRRAFLRGGAGGLLALLAERAFAREAHAETKGAKRIAKPRSCIVLWMNGGPSHIDTFDPKPGTSAGGPFKAIPTRARGVSIGEHLPELAGEAHRLAIIRGMTSKEGNHNRAQYLMHTGYAPNPTVVHPSMGAWVSSHTSNTTGMPAFVSIGGPSAGGGFLGVDRGPFVVQKGGQMPANVEARIDDARFDRRRAMLDVIDANFARDTGDAKVNERRALYTNALAMMRAKNLEAFSLESETLATKKAYGDTDFGRGCLAARRLVESGTRFVEVVLDGWDTHKDNFGRTKTLMGTIDPAMSALLRDLDARNLLASTLVVWIGEFGRTPKINGNDGRDHHPQAWSAVLAGANVRGGIVHGETDAEGEKVVKEAVSVPDLFATIATALGLAPDETQISPIGRPIALTDNGKKLVSLLAP